MIHIPPPNSIITMEQWAPYKFDQIKHDLDCLVDAIHGSSSVRGADELQHMADLLELNASFLRDRATKLKGKVDA